MIELVMVIAIIGIIAGVAVPRMSRAAESSRENALVSNLSLIQSAIDRYTAEHGGLSPGHDSKGSVDTSEGVFEDRLMQRTDDRGDTQKDGLLGPYLRSMPKNPINGLRSVRIDGAAPGANTHGWHYDATSQTIQSDHGSGALGGGKLDIDLDVGALGELGMEVAVDPK